MPGDPPEIRARGRLAVPSESMAAHRASSRPAARGDGPPLAIRERAARLAERACGWLLEAPIVTADGNVLSWLNPAKPGYVYAEIMGYYVGFAAEVLTGERAAAFAGARERGARVARALAALADDPASPPGGLGGLGDPSAALGASQGSAGALGRGSIAYVFDTCIALDGLIRFARATGEDPHRATLERMADFVDRSLDGSAFAPRAFAWEAGRPAPAPESWSLNFGASALKTVLALHRAAAHLARPALAQRADEVCRAVCDAAWRDGAFRIHAGSEKVYAHAHSYALEGLLFLRAEGRVPDGVDAGALLQSGTAWSAARQNDDGSLTGWHAGPGAEPMEGDHQGDATAQSLRLWQAVDRERYAASIERALGFLEGLQEPAGGLRYNAGSADVNAWVTMFAWQAADWLARERRGADAARVL